MAEHKHDNADLWPQTVRALTRGKAKALLPAAASQDPTVIEIRLNTPEQMLDSFDPAPFQERDLDDKAADYILDSADDMTTGEALALVIDLPREQAERDLARDLPATIRNSFRMRAQRTRRELRHLFRIGRLSLVIGLTVLGLCILVVQLLGIAGQQSTMAQTMEQGLFILGWVAIWRPLEIFLYDWWPLKKRIHLLDRLSAAPVEIRPR